MIWPNQFVHLDWIGWNNDKEKGGGKRVYKKHNL